MKLLYPLAKRFIAGHDINSMLENIAYYDLVTINYVGESATTPCIAEANLKEYKALINALKSLSHREYEISLKLTQFGMTPTEWKDPVTELTDQVKDIPFIKLKFDMEKESLIDDTLKFSRCFDDVGIVLQANMQRSYFDIDKAMESYTRVRICKGAYKGNIRNMDDIRKNYLNIVEEIFKSGYFYHKDYKQDFIALGTHDEYLIENIKKLSRQYGGKQKFYFEMLFGIRRDLAKRLIGEGYSVRTYIPYGADWMPYVIRRLCEFKNLKFVGVNIIKELFAR